MKIINTRDNAKYVVEIDSTVPGKGRSAEFDVCGMRKALKGVIRACGSSCLPRLTEDEVNLLHQVLALGEEGDKVKLEGVKPRDPLASVKAEERRVFQEKIARIKKSRDAEEAIRAETMRRGDRRDAAGLASGMQGVVEAKKLEKTSGPVSLKDLMGDNAFIEESMKHSHIAHTVANPEGWDTDKMEKAQAERIPTSQDIGEEVVPPVSTVPEKPEAAEDGEKAPGAVPAASTDGSGEAPAESPAEVHGVPAVTEGGEKAPGAVPAEQPAEQPKRKGRSRRKGQEAAEAGESAEAAK